MPQIDEDHRAHHNSLLIALAVCSALVVAAVIGYLIYRHNLTAADNREFNNLQTIANLDSADAKYADAATLWLNYASHTPSRDHRQTAYENAAAQYVSGGQYASALKVCKQSESAFGVTFKEAELAATAAMQSGDKSTAIHYYQQAIKLVPSDLSDKDSEVSVFNEAIKELQAQK